MKSRSHRPTPAQHPSTGHSHRWYPEEEPGFLAGLHRSEPQISDADPVADLRLSTTPRRPARRSLSPTPTATLPARNPRRSDWLGRFHVLPIVYLSALSLLGYTFATRSIEAFSNAWRNTDTRSVRPQAPSPEPGSAPAVPQGPFGTVISSPGALHGLVPFLSRRSMGSENAVVAAAPGNAGTY